MVKIHIERCSRKELLNEEVSTFLVSGLYTTILNSIIWRNQYKTDRIIQELHEVGRQIGVTSYSLLRKALDTLNMDKIDRYVEDLWKIVFLREPDECNWDKRSNQVIIVTKACELCENISASISFPCCEAIAGFIEAIVELAMEEGGLKGRFSSLIISCHESECKVEDDASNCTFILSIRGEVSER